MFGRQKTSVFFSSQLVAAPTLFIDTQKNKQADKKGERKRKKLSIPESINLDELNWVRYRKEIISIYHRIIKGNDLSYKDQKHTIAPTSLGQRLEELVSDAYYIYFKPTKQEPKPVITS